MAFALTTKQIELRGNWLVATVQNSNTEWVSSQLDLNEYIGNREGEFDVTSSGWFNSAKEWSWRLEGTIMFAQLMTGAGWYGNETSINLNLFVKNDDGTLKFQRLHDSIMISACCFKLEYTTLRGLCIAPNGRLSLSEIDLNEHYGNTRGSFESEDRHFASTGSNFRLNLSTSALKLVGELQDGDHIFRSAEVDLSICIVNQNGRLEFVKHDGLLDRDGWLTMFLEHLPLVGFVVSGVQLLNGNEEQAARALAVCTNSSIVCVGILIGAAIGTFCGNPIIGGVIGAGLASPLGILAETEIKKALIDDPHVRSQFEEATLGRYIYETLRNMVAAGAAGYLAEEFAAALGPEIDPIISKVISCLNAKDISVIVDFSIYGALKRATDALRGETIQEWDEVEKKVKDLIDEKQGGRACEAEFD